MNLETQIGLISQRATPVKDVSEYAYREIGWRWLAYVHKTDFILSDICSHL
jgi:hypothetical protein